MNAEIIQQLIADQRNSLLRKDRGIIRNIDISKHSNTNLISVITGIRRSGKSTFTLQLADHYESFYYINFDDERLINFQIEDFNTLMIEFKRNFDSKVIVIDEIQLISGWERFVRRIFDEGFKVIITGCNAKLLGSELATHLTGRYVKTELFPFSLHEVLIYKNIDFNDKSSDNLAKILNVYEWFIENGGFPEYVKTEENEILKRIYDDIIYRDLIVRFAVRNITSFKNLSQFLFTNFTSENNYLPLSKILGLSSSTSVKDYIYMLCEGYLIYELNRYDYSLKKQYTFNKKYYSIDNGLRNAVSFRISQDNGRLLENLVFIELKRRQHEVWYYKSKNNLEVDFLINPQNPELIQVCYDISNPLTLKREVDSLTTCMKELSVSKGLILTKNQQSDEFINHNIDVIPVWRWLLS